MYIKRIEKTTANGANHSTDNHKRSGVANLRQRGTLEYTCQREHENEREIVDAGADGAGVVDGLKVDGEVVEDIEVGAGEEELEEAACPYPAEFELINVSK